MKYFVLFRNYRLIGLRRLIQWISLSVLSAASLTQTAFASSEIFTFRNDQTDIAISLYQHDLALIKDTRRITLAEGRNNLIWQEISTGIKPETAWISHLKHPEHFQVIAQHFDLDLLTPQKLLESHTGQSITVIRTNPVTGVENKETATVLTTNGGIVLKFADRIETGIPGRLVFSEIPGNLHEKPTMTALLNMTAANTGNLQHDLQLTYLTHGLFWRADYILELDEQDRHANLIGFATLTNQSGIAYHQARFQLIAGDVNQTGTVRTMPAKRMSLAAESASAPQLNVESESHFELHRYTLPGKITLPDSQSKQIAFMSANRIPVEKRFILQGQNHYYSNYYFHPEQKQAVDVFIKFRNSGDGLGIPLPRGVMRAYKNDPQGDLHYVGEDHMDHTADKATVQLKLGHAFDITAEKKQTDFKKIPTADQSARHLETAHQISLKNAKKEAVTIIVREPIPGDWTMLSESMPHKKTAANLAEWQIKLSAESHTVLTYRVRVKL